MNKPESQMYHMLKRGEPKAEKSEEQKLTDRIVAANRRLRAKSKDPQGNAKRAALRGCL
jgi:hypothetical protein